MRVRRRRGQTQRPPREHLVDALARKLTYGRLSTDQQSTARQDLVLAEAGIEDWRRLEVLRLVRGVR